MSSILHEEFTIVRLTVRAVKRILEESNLEGTYMRFSTDNNVNFVWSQDFAEENPQYEGEVVKVASIKRQRDGKGFVLYSQVNALKDPNHERSSIMAFVWGKASGGMLVQEYLATCARWLDRELTGEAHPALFFVVSRERTVTVGLDEVLSDEGVYLIDGRNLEAGVEAQLRRYTDLEGKTQPKQPRKGA